MTLNEAIGGLQKLLDSNNFSSEEERGKHEQLLVWLVELQELRKKYFWLR